MLLLCAMLLYALPAKAQTAVVDLPSTTISIEKLFSEIEKQTNYLMVFSNRDLNIKQTITLPSKKGEVAKILNEALKNTGLSYEYTNNYIVISKAKGDAKQKAGAQTPAANAAANRVIGTVTDASGEPLIGANVSVAGMKGHGVVTDMDGNFAIDAPADATLDVSYIGYADQKVAVDGQNNLSIVLREDAQSLNEVVVVGYGVQKKVNLSGAVANVNTKQLENRPVLNVGNALQGTVANLNVTVGTGQAISTPSFNIRGTTSINGGSPLIVIDGVASDAGELNRMNPNDIASISVLKDAASCAIYGAKAAYGVILVTTKTASDEKLTIHYNNNFSFTSNTKMPKIISDPYTVATMRNDAYYPWGTIYNQEQLDYAKKVSEDPTLSPYFLNPNGTYTYYGQTDWVAEAYKKSSFATAHSVDFSGTTNKVDYYFSAGYNYHDGMIKYHTDKYNRYNINTKLNFKITDWWNISNNTIFTTYDYKAPTNLSGDTYWAINRISPLDVPKNPDGTWTSAGSNPLGLLSEGGDWAEYNTLVRTNFGTRLDVIKNVLWVQGTFAYTSNKGRNNWFYAPVPYTDGPDRPIRYQNEVPSTYSSNSDNKDIYIDLYATFNKTFAEKHDVNVMVGYNQEEYEYYSGSMSRNELISTSVPVINLATGDPTVSESKGSYATRSGFARLGYIYDNRYILEFNGRYDGTSKFPKNDRYVFSPSGSIAWVVSQENFWTPLRDVVNFFKARASYGKLGNQDVSGYYPYLATMSSSKLGAIIEGKQPVAAYAPGLVSGSLTWEKVTTLNIGGDINFLNNKFTISGDWYIRRTKDMLTAGKPLPGVLGTGVPTANAADLKTKGWELTFNYNDQFMVAGKPLSIGLAFNIADSRAWITKFDNPSGSLSNYYVGYEMGEMWGLVTEGFFKDEDDIKNHANQTPITSYPGTPPTAAGDLKFADLDGDGIINSGAWTLEDHGDYKLIGNNRSRYTYGININAAWNGIDFSMFLQGVGKRNYYPGSDDLYFWGIYAQPWTNITYGNMYDHWSEDNPDGYYPRLKSYVAFQGGVEAAATQTKYLQNAAYLRLKNLQVGYTIPESITRKMHINRLRVFFTGDNLAVWSGLYKHYKMDPEGLAGNSYPLQKSLSFGLNVTF